MTEQHPITPPPELVKQWLAEPEYVSGWNGKCMMLSITDYRFNNICAKASQWGADQELEACCNWITNCEEPFDELDLYNARRPKPPSLKAQAFAALKNSPVDPVDETLQLSADSELIIRRALSLLNDDN
jgi:hypothetical protein